MMLNEYRRVIAVGCRLQSLLGCGQHRKAPAAEIDANGDWRDSLANAKIRFLTREICRGRSLFDLFFSLLLI